MNALDITKSDLRCMMYQYFKGEIVEKGSNYVVIDVNGVGYYLTASAATLQYLKIGEIQKIYTKLIVKEDAQSLCGFFEEEERGFFEHLISVSGIGQRVAMNILSEKNYISVLEAIIKADEKQLTKLPGLGKKTAQRLIVELRDKFTKLYGRDIESLDSTLNITSQPCVNQDVLLALMGLGFKKDEVQMMLKDVNTTSLTVEEAIKHALKYSRS